MMRTAVISAALLAAPITLLAQAEPDPVIPFAPDDPEMNAAIAEARQSLPLFLLNTVDAEGYGPQGGYLKVGFPVKALDMNTENIWVGPFAALDGDAFIGLLANEPVAMPGLHVGDQVSFDYDMIVDWSLETETGQYLGDYTTRVVMTRLPADQAAALGSRFADQPYPTEWERALD